MSLIAALDELETLLKADTGVQAWLAKYSVRNKALTVLRTNRQVTDIPEKILPCLIFELPQGNFGDRENGGLRQNFEHEVDLVFALQVGRHDYKKAFDARIELVDQVLPSFFLKQDRLANYVSDAKLLKFDTDSGVHFPKVFVQATISLTGKCKRDI
jgi:hypothetical protein